MASLNPGDQVCVIAECSRRGQFGTVEQLLPAAIDGDDYQVCVITFTAETGGTLKEHYLVKELRAADKRLKPEASN